jgi:hypothetical protein
VLRIDGYSGFSNVSMMSYLHSWSCVQIPLVFLFFSTWAYCRQFLGVLRVSMVELSAPMVFASMSSFFFSVGRYAAAE